MLFAAPTLRAMLRASRSAAGGQRAESSEADLRQRLLGVLRHLEIGEGEI